jgi:hypothetical protein
MRRAEGEESTTEARRKYLGITDDALRRSFVHQHPVPPCPGVGFRAPDGRAPESTSPTETPERGASTVLRGVHLPVSKGKQRDLASRAAGIVDVDVNGLFTGTSS